MHAVFVDCLDHAASVRRAVARLDGHGFTRRRRGAGNPTCFRGVEFRSHQPRMIVSLNDPEGVCRHILARDKPRLAVAVLTAADPDAFVPIEIKLAK